MSVVLLWTRLSREEILSVGIVIASTVGDLLKEFVVDMVATSGNEFTNKLSSNLASCFS